jgi:hypothetical protein
MKNIDELRSKLLEVKEDLTKNTNVSYGSAVPNQVGANALMQCEGRDNSDQNNKEPQLAKPKGTVNREQPSIEKDEIGDKDLGNGRYIVGDNSSPGQADKNMREVCKFAKNGQWSLENTPAQPAAPAQPTAPAQPVAQPETLKIGKDSNGKFRGYRWRVGGAMKLHPEEFNSHDEAKAHFESKGHIIKAEEGENDLVEKEQKGVHMPEGNPLDPGQSEAGGDYSVGRSLGIKRYVESAKEKHRQKLSELKEMPKPKLPDVKKSKSPIDTHVEGALLEAEHKEGQVPSEHYHDPKYMSNRKKDIKSQAVKNKIKENLDPKVKKSIDEIADLIKSLMEE